MSSENISVKFRFNEIETVVQVYHSDLSISAILKDIADKFMLPSKCITLYRDGDRKRISGNCELHEICQNDFGIVDVNLELSDLAHEINERRNVDDQIKLSSEVYYRFEGIIGITNNFRK